MWNEVLSELIGITGAVLRSLLFVWFFGKFGAKRITLPLLHWLLPAACYGGLIYALGELWDTSYRSLALFGKQAVSYGILFLLVFLFFQIEIHLRLIATVLFSAASELLLVLTMNAAPLFEHLIEHLGEDLNRGALSPEEFLGRVYLLTAGQLIFYTVAYYLLFFLSLLFMDRLFREKSYPYRPEQTVFLVVPALAGLFTALLFRTTMYTLDDDGLPVVLFERYPILYLLSPIILILMLSMIFCSIYLFQNLLRSSTERNERIILTQQVGAMRSHMEELGRLNERIRSLRHDLKNHIAVLTRLAEKKPGNEELKAYLAALQEDMKEAEPLVSCGDPVVDALLSMKAHEALRRMPDCVFSADRFRFSEKLAVRSYDMTILLGNALDNAIEACEKCRSDRFITVSSTVRNAFFLFTVQNRYEVPIIVGADGLPETKKEDRSEHGIGMRNMERIASRYHGGIDWHADEHVFTLNVMLQGEL